MIRKGFLVLLCCFTLLGMLSGCETETAQQTPENAILSEFSAMDLNGNVVDQSILSDHKLTMINVWGTFCMPCIGEMPDLAVLSKADPEQFQIIGIVVDAADRNLQVLPDKKAEALEIIAQTGADYLHLLPSASLNKAFLSEVQAIPHTIFVDSQGRQVGPVYTGAKSQSQWKSIIEHLLKTID